MTQSLFSCRICGGMALRPGEASAYARKICYIAGMEPLTRRLTVVGAVILCGAVAGVALGDFAAGPGGGRLPDVQAALGLATEPATPEAPEADTVLAARSGPASYHCEGCDAGLHNEVTLEDGAFPEVEPLPPYQPETSQPAAAAPVTAPRVQVPSITLPVLEPGSAIAQPQPPATPR